MLPLVAPMLFVLAAAPAVPRLLTESDPGAPLRWQAVTFRADAPTEGGRAFEWDARPPVVLRFEGTRARCEPVVKRRFVGPGGRADVALPVYAAGERRTVVVPPALARPAAGAPGAALENEPVATFVVELPRGCALQPPRAYQAVLDEDDKEGPLRVVEGLESLARASGGDAEASAWSRASHAHRWQEAVAEVAVLRRLLERVPGTDAAMGPFVEALTERATREAPWPDIQYVWHTRVALAGATVDVASDPGGFTAMTRGQVSEIELGAAEALRVHARAPLPDGDTAPVATRVLVTFEGRTPIVVPIVAGRDAEAPGVTRARTLVIPIPLGARSVRLSSLDGALLVRGELLRRKRHLQDGLFSPPPSSPTADADARAALCRSIAEGLRGDRRALERAALLAPARGPLAAWLAVEHARLDAGGDASRELRDAAALLAPADDDLEAAGAALVRARGTWLRAQLELASDRASEAVRTVLDLASVRPLTDEEAAWLADAQALVGDDAVLGGHVLAAIDGLLARRPLDRVLGAAHARAFVLDGQWRRLSPLGVRAEIAFLDAPEGPSAASRAAFVAVGGGANVDVPPPASADRLSVLTFATAPSAKPEVRTVGFDGRFLARLPATATFDTNEIAVAPGRHRIEVSNGAGTLVNFAAAPAGAAILRRYAPLDEGPSTWLRTELGLPTTIQISIRVARAGREARVDPFELLLETSDGERRTVSVTPAQSAPGFETLPAPWSSSAPIEVVLPLAAAARTITLSAPRLPGVRLFVHAAARERRPLRQVGRAARADGAPALSRARALAAADEPLLAREALLELVEARQLGDAERAAAAGLWRELDEASAPAAAGGPPSPLSPGLCAISQREEATVADAAALALLSAARLAEESGDARLAAGRWSELAVLRPGCAALQRQAALALLAADPGADASARATVALVAASATNPSDVLTARALRKARRRTRFRSIPFAERSAGSYLLQTPRGEGADGAEPVVVAWPHEDQRAGIVGKDRDLSLTFSVPRAARVVVRVAPVELRPRTAEALATGSVALEWSRDGAPMPALSCAAGRECATAAFDVGPGAHLLTARLSGGVRPAARLWLDDTGPASGGLRRASLSSETAPRRAPTALGTAFVSEHLAATPGAPIHLTVEGPVVLRVELRRRPGEDTGAATVETRVAGGEATVREVPLPGGRDAEMTGPELGGVSQPTALELPLAEARPYAVEIRARTRLVLARIGVWEGVTDLPADPPIPLAFVSHEPAPGLAPLTLREAPAVTIVDGDVAPGHDDLGSFGIWTAAHRVSTDPEGAPVQTMTSLRLGATYRRLVERAHTTLKLDGAERFNGQGAPSQAVSTSLFFIHPEHRAVRLGLDADARTQPIGNQREWAGRVSLLVEPVVTLASGLHLVSKLSSWWSRRSLTSTTAALLPYIDPEVFNAYSQTHPRALAWEEGLEGEPFLNAVVYASVRATTNPSFHPTDVDHVSASLFARALFGRAYLEALGRTTWFFADGDRVHATRHTWLGARAFHTLWPTERHMLEVGAVAGYDFGTHAPELSVSLGWEWSNGRRFADHSPREGEDFFFAERGPGLGTTQLTVTP